MKDPIYIVRTKFINIMTGIQSIGYRFYDDHCSGYCNSLEDIPKDDMELLKEVISHEDFPINNVSCLNLPIDIDGNLYKYNDIAYFINQEYENGE